MKDNFFTSMLSEGGKISHKRVIAVTAALVLSFMAVYATFHYKEFVVHIFDWLVAFVLIMSGVATLPQLVALIRGGAMPVEKSPNNSPDKPDGNGGDSTDLVGPRPDDRKP